MSKQTLLPRLNVTVTAFPRRLQNARVRLRPYRLTDLPRLFRLLDPEVLREASGVALDARPSFLGFCLWMRLTFPLAYVIESQETPRRRVGFLGLYRLTPGASAWLSLVMFRPSDRRQGFGRQALTLLLQGLGRQRAVAELYADVRPDNLASRRFFRQLGFVPCDADAERLRLVTQVFAPVDPRRHDSAGWRRA